ncbi:hypothetical protein O7606_24535 [Micromonospora sp. WMMD882]|uniref:hypothetical protein n=1 Tax=Micromonospora sp. WMMD882 TaxID=3015151 RepID=UPI00248BD0A8|nr:hypothetical protein [Micromonospora sp. WMMD882]WBB79300.1 hypothetical protein O7606_24535 [Micromonospora sp. WMMD882]
MRIDDRVEQRVRETLHLVVKRRKGEFEKALRDFPDEQTRTASLELLVAVSLFVLLEAFEGRPANSDLDDLAEELAHMEDSLPFTEDEYRAFLLAILDGVPLESALPPNVSVILAFVVAGSLLSSRQKPEGEWWFDYLDKIEEAIEQAPDVERQSAEGPR